MGRLGFNLVRQKEAAAAGTAAAAGGDVVKSTAINVEAGGIADNQENESNENAAHIGELLLAVDEKNRTIKNLRLVVASLTTVILCLCAFIVITQSAGLCNDGQVAPSDNEAKVVAERMEALQGDYNVLNQAKQDQEQNCSDKEKAWLANQQRLNIAFTEQNAKYAELQDVTASLRAEHAALASECRSREDELKAEVKRLTDERASREQARSQRLRKLGAALTTTSTTEAPARKSLVGEQFEKIHELMKDIQSDPPFGNMEEFIKKTDEIFGL